MTKRRLFAELSEGFEALAEHRMGKTTLTTVEAHSTAPVVSYPKGRSDDEAMVEMIKADPEFAKAYLAVALEEAEQPGGMDALRVVLRHVAQAQGISAIAQRAGISRESLIRSLGPKGNPTVKALLTILSASGLRLTVSPRTA
jgi:probable addiction module antidote protein